MQYQDGQTATNPTTGERVVFRNGVWQPAASPAAPGGLIPVTPPRPPAAQTPSQAALDDTTLALRQRELTAQTPIPQGRMTEQQQSNLVSRYRSLSGLQTAIDDLETLYQENLAGERGSVLGVGGNRNFRARLPLAPTGYATFDASAGRLIDQIIQAFDITGGEANSIAELRARFGPYMPASTDNDETIQSKLGALRGILQRQRGDIGSQLDHLGLRPADSGPSPADPANPAAVQPGEAIDRTERTVTTAGTDPRLQVSHGDEEAGQDPNRARINLEAQRHLTQMLKRGAPDAEIRDYARSLNINVEDAIRYRRTPDWQRWRRQNPNQLFPFRDEGANIPMGAVDSAVAAAAASPVGAAAIHYANAASAGTVPLIGDLTGTGEQTRLGLEATRRENPGSALFGELAGGATAYGLGSRFMSRAAPNFLASRPITRSVLGDAAYGGLYGTGENHDPISGALEAAIGGRVAHGLTRGIASTVSPTGGGLRSLFSQGVRPTVGQRFRESGPIGTAVNFVEEGAQSIPVAGQFIRANRSGARDQWERGGWNMTLDNIGARLPDDTPLGPQAHQYAQRAFDDAYDRVRSQLSFSPDANWASDLATVRADASLLTTGVRRRFNRIADDLEQRITQAGPAMNGERFKAAASEINGEVRRLRGLRNPTQAQQELLSTLEELDSAFHSGARRSSPPEAIAELDRVDRGYAMLTRIEDASRRRPGQVGRFTPSDILQVEARNGGARGRRFSAGEGLFTGYADQGRSLEDVLPSSGTSERAALMASLGSGGVALGASGGAYALGADPEDIGAVASLPFLLNAPGVRSALRPRGGYAEWLADWIRRRRAIEGAGAAGVAYGNDRN